jgi:hypothetical protein
MTSLDNVELTAFHLLHNIGEDFVDERIERRISNQIVGDVNKEALVRANRRSDGVDNVG